MKNKSFIFYGLALVLLAGALGAGGYFSYKYQELAKSPAILSQKDFDSTLDDVGKLMQLPTDEQPSVATITDVEQLREAEPFFEKAENGDKLVAYSKALKAILYRPSNNKIIDVVPLVINEDEGLGGEGESATEGPSVGENPIVSIYNGTISKGLAEQANSNLVGQFGDEITIGTTANATNTDYVDTLVIDLSGSNPEKALDLANYFSGNIVTSVPEGEETNTETDILIILGSSWTPLE